MGPRVVISRRLWRKICLKGCVLPQPTCFVLVLLLFKQMFEGGTEFQYFKGDFENNELFISSLGCGGTAVLPCVICVNVISVYRKTLLNRKVQ